MEKYYLFKNEHEISYIFGPKGFNNDSNYGFSKLKLWKFSGDNHETHFITAHEQILAYFHRGDALVQLLLKNNVAFEEMEIKEVGYDGQSPLPQMDFLNGAYLVTHIGDSRFTFCYLKNSEGVRLFNYPLDKGFCHKKYQEDSVLNKFQVMRDHLLKSEMKLVIEAGPDRNGNPPGWLTIRTDRGQGFEFNESIKTIVGVICAIILFILLMKYS